MYKKFSHILLISPFIHFSFQLKWPLMATAAIFCQAIFKIYVAHLKTFGIQKNAKRQFPKDGVRRVGLNSNYCINTGAACY